MFFLKTVYFFWSEFVDKYLYKDVSKNKFVLFCKTYKFFIKYSSNFEKFFNKYTYLNVSSKSKFFYLYVVYYICKKYNIIKNGQFRLFLKLCIITNKIPLIKSYTKKFYPISYYFNIFFKQYLKLKFGVGYLQNISNKNIYYSNPLFKNFINNSFKKSKELFTKDLFKSVDYIKNYVKQLPAIKPNKEVRYNSTSIVKYINDNSKYTVYFLRKNRLFNKGRYSRNRQNYRTGVYWCLYINIIALFSLYFFFYRFTFNFGYLWWLFYCLPASFIIPQVIRHRLYNPFILFTYVIDYLKFILNCLSLFFFKNKK